MSSALRRKNAIEILLEILFSLIFDVYRWLAKSSSKRVGGSSERVSGTGKERTRYSLYSR
jgi:hypothetical protein